MATNVLQPRSRLRVKLQGVFALMFIQVSSELHTLDRVVFVHLTYSFCFQWSCYISLPAPPSDYLPPRVVESAELFHRNTYNQLGDVGESGDPHIMIILAQ